MEIRIPYTPRKVQREIHDKIKRWNVVVMHRRAGKTVWAVNEIIKQALTCKLPRPRVAYIGPTAVQARRVAWDYLKQYTSSIPQVKFNETQLTVDLPNDSRIMLLSSENGESIRGLYLDFVVLDEYQMHSPRVFPEIIRPALSDREGGAVFTGTPSGHNHFFDMLEIAKKEVAEKNNNWNYAICKASESGILPDAELKAAQEMMAKEQYEQEYECSFSAGVMGAYYAELIDELDDKGRIGDVPYDPNEKVHTSWDIGVTDSTSIIFFQHITGGGIHIIDYLENTGKGLPWYIKELEKKNYYYGEHIAPWDIEAKEFGTGRSRVETALNLGIRFRVCPKLKIADGIHAVRQIIPRCKFDREQCAELISALRQYRQEWSERNQRFLDRPHHGWESHPADAMRYLAIGLPRDSGFEVPQQKQAQTSYNIFS